MPKMRVKSIHDVLYLLKEFDSYIKDEKSRKKRKESLKSI